MRFRNHKADIEEDKMDSPLIGMKDVVVVLEEATRKSSEKEEREFDSFFLMKILFK